MTLKRLPHWETKLFHQFLVDSAHLPFEWGTQDCALFAANGIQSITGQDIAVDFRDKYHDEAGAFQTIKDVCGGKCVADAAAYCAAKFGLNPLDKPLMAQRGDLVVLQAPSRALVAGIVGLDGHIVSVYEKGLFRLPLKMATHAWHY
jgi:hypothetical protein